MTRTSQILQEFWVLKDHTHSLGVRPSKESIATRVSWREARDSFEIVGAAYEAYRDRRREVLKGKTQDRDGFERLNIISFDDRCVNDKRNLRFASR